MEICLCATTGISATLSVNCECGTSIAFCTVWAVEPLSLHNNGLSPALSNNLQLWDLDGLGPPVDLLLDDELLSLHCQLDDFRLLHIDCVGDVLNMRVHNLVASFLASE